MGIFETAKEVVGGLSLTPRGWRILAGVLIAVLLTGALAAKRLIVYSIQSDRQTFVDRDAANAALAAEAKGKADAVDREMQERTAALAIRVETVEKAHIELKGDVKAINDNVLLMRDIMLERYGPPTQRAGVATPPAK